jgi:hypothetical protein
VVEPVGQGILRLLFVKEDAAHGIADFLDLLELAAAGDPPIDRRKEEMLVREMIGEPNAEAKNISRSQKLLLQTMTAPSAAFILELDGGSVDEIIVDSERLAFERGWHPALIRRQPA